MKTLKIVTYGILGVILSIGILSFTMQDAANNLIAKNHTITKTWKLPKELNEISGIAWLSENTIASVQDEDGIIFIYDLTKSKVIDEIAFSGPGDYEGIAIHNNDSYVLRSDGTIYEVSNFRNESRTVQTFKTDFSEKNNMESLTMNAKTNSLIIAPKDWDFKNDYKGLYEIPIKSKNRNTKPSVKINMNDDALKSYKNKKAYKTFSPSDVAIHPITGEYYVLEGKNPKLLILDAKGTIKTVHELDKKTFAQPEGITFSPNGTLYIANEAGDDSANIIQVSFK